MTLSASRLTSETACHLIAPIHWRHVSSTDNPADCASRGLFPSEVLGHSLWWDGPKWESLDESEWPTQSNHLPPNDPSDEVAEIGCHSTVMTSQLLFPLDRYSNFTRITRITAWIQRFVANCRARKQGNSRNTASLNVQEINHIGF